MSRVHSAVGGSVVRCAKDVTWGRPPLAASRTRGMRLVSTDDVSPRSLKPRQALSAEGYIFQCGLKLKSSRICSKVIFDFLVRIDGRLAVVLGNRTDLGLAVSGRQ